MDKIIINSLQDMRMFAKDLVSELSAGSVVALSGNLGAGKTTLVQMASKLLGVRRGVLSPSFSILKIYPARAGKIKKVCHIDFYRLAKKEALLGAKECFDDNEAVCFVEWAERAKEIIPKCALWLEIKIKKGNIRVITKTSAN